MPAVIVLTASQALSVSSKNVTPRHHTDGLPVRRALLVRQCDQFLDGGTRRGIVATECMGETRVAQRIHRRRRLSDLASIGERLMGIREGRLGMAEQPQRDRAVAADRHSDVMPESGGKRAMRSGIVGDDRPIKMPSSLDEVACPDQCDAEAAMSEHQRRHRPDLLCVGHVLHRLLSRKMSPLKATKLAVPAANRTDNSCS